jgi:Asp-tRNA(Asn)/Glu-tRNA(Gln) amidotransferase A subunit family amidase
MRSAARIVIIAAHPRIGASLALKVASAEGRQTSAACPIGIRGVTPMPTILDFGNSCPAAARRRLSSLVRGLVAAGFFAVAPLQVGAAAPTKFHVEEATIASIQRAIVAHELTSTELVKLYLARIKAYNGPAVEEPEGILGPVKLIPHGHQLNALSTLNLRPTTRKAWGFDDRKARSMTDAKDDDPAMPDALEVAAKLDAEFAKSGKLTGPLHGVVIAIKDQFDTFDLRTTSGADVAYANDRPPRDSTFAARLRAAGAIVIGKANMGEYASGFRSSFGGMLVSAYDTERTPGGSSGGSATAVAANLCTVAIAEETGPSVRAPAQYANTVGIAPTQELVSRVGMINIGLNTRIGPIARTVEDAARVLTVIAGYDPQDEMTAFAVGRLPEKPYETFTHEPSLTGVRIGVVREYMDKNVFSKAELQNIELIERAVEDLKKLGATIIDPGPGGELFTRYVRRLNPALSNASWTKLFPELFPVGADGKPAGDHIATLVGLAMDPAKVPGKVTIRDFGAATAVGENKYGYDLYLAQRGDANIKTLDDLINKATFYLDDGVPTKKLTLETANKPAVLDTAVRLQRRFAIQQIVLACLAEEKLDAIVCPTGLDPSRKLDAPGEPTTNGLTNYGMFTFLGAQGFPAITVPAGFTTQVYDRVFDPSLPPPSRGEGGEFAGAGPAPRYGSRLTGPVPAKLPVGVDFMGRPFSEPVLLKIAAAYESVTHHRTPPPGFDPL